MKYILNERFRLRGWEKLPFAVFDSMTCRSEFFQKDQFLLLMRCDGVQEVDEEALPEEQRKWLAHLERDGVISQCGSGSMLLPQQLYKRYPCRYKHDVHWSITGRCNYKCKHCLVSAPHAKFGHPTTEQLLGLVKQMADCGIASVSITGGEPLIRKDFWQIVDALVEHGIGISAIFTNGYLVNDALLDGLEALAALALLEQYARTSDLELVALATHLLHENREVENASTGNLDASLVGQLLDAHRHVVLGLLL